ncbi:MAG: cytochrome c biogenesis protein ResB, partial [Planctomycetes bacterium]|nr:cytochrome c biogenesis protein ResB [Planctomycetota bacterium]
FEDAGHGVEASVLTGAYDPGRPLKYLGSLMICAGIVVMFYFRAYVFKSVPTVMPRRSAIAAAPVSSGTKSDAETILPKPHVLPRRRRETNSTVSCPAEDP